MLSRSSVNTSSHQFPHLLDRESCCILFNDVPQCTSITRHLFRTLIYFPFAHMLYKSILLDIHVFFFNSFVSTLFHVLIWLSPVQKAYVCINCRYEWWSGKGPVRCLSPSLLSPGDGWLCWPVEGLTEFWRGWNHKIEVQRIRNGLWSISKKRQATFFFFFFNPQGGVDYSSELDDERKCAADEMIGKVWGGARRWPTVGPAEFSWGLLLRLRGGFGELGGVREAHTRWSIWYSSCCRSQYSSLSNRV